MKIRYLKNIILILVLSCITNQLIVSQFSVINDSIINEYKKVTSISTDRVQVHDISGFSSNDIALIIQMKGATIDDAGILIGMANTGRYEVLLIDTVIAATKEIVFTADISNDYDISEPVQIITVPRYENARNTVTLTAQQWNDSTGGVLAIIVNNTLQLGADIDVSGKGFKGADPSGDADYTGICSRGITEYEQKYYPTNTLNRSGLKGDGILTDSFNKMRGYGRSRNGGGGGNGRFAGGGGGGNYGKGGDGGYEINLCESNPIIRAEGGFLDPENWYSNFLNRVYMGGGGGTGTQNVAGNKLATPGGNGGGIIFIIADTLMSNGYSIKANGRSVSGSATAGAGGGGAGGTVVLDISAYKDLSLGIEVTGGAGGNTSDAQFTGPGGGGGGGMVWYSKNQLPQQIFDNINFDGGNRGSRADAGSHGATPGSPGGSLSSLIIPLNGFLFNSVTGNQRICLYDVPSPLKGSQPKGGTGSYNYQWQESADLNTWINAGTNSDSIFYQPPSLSDTTYYRRIVTSGSLNDTSKVLSIIVHNPLTGNGIGTDQLICEGAKPLALQGDIYGGGDGVDYSYQWRQSKDDDDYNDILFAGDQEIYQPTSLNETTYYQRILMSGGCYDTSNTVLIEVLPAIVNNIIAENHQVCEGNDADLLTGEVPQGGDEGNYRYEWLYSAEGSLWQNPSGDIDNKDYLPGGINDTLFYRRIVRSGLNDVCTDTSNTVTIELLNSISENTIFGEDTICEDTRANNITGTNPTGGTGLYKYVWLDSNDQSSWDSVFSSGSNEPYEPGILMSDHYYRRIIHSGENKACVDTSNAVLIKVIDKIMNNTISDSQELCEGDLPVPLTGSDPSGGINSYGYTWEMRLSGNTSWDALEEPFDQKNYSFSTVPEPGKVYIRRTIESGVCADVSDSITITMLPGLDGNSINAPAFVCYGNSPGLITSQNITGGSGEYVFNWQQSNDQLLFTDIEENGSNLGYTPPDLTEEVSYRRIINSGACIDTSNSVTININTLPEGVLANQTDTICEGETIDLDFTLSGNPEYTLYFSDNESNTFVESTSEEIYQLTLSPSSSIIYSIDSIIDGNNCKAASVEGEHQVIFFEIPDANAGADERLCAGEYRLNANTNYQGIWLAVEGNVSFDNINDPQTTITPVDEYGSFILRWTTSNWNCSNSDEVTITLDEAPSDPFAGNDSILNFMKNLQLNAATPEVGTGTWSTNDVDIIFDDENDPKTIVRNLSLGRNVLTWTIENGSCESLSDSIVLSVNDLSPPEGFSPNDDGINDAFIISGLESFPESSKKELTIINRWGKEVYHSPDYKNDWNGVNKDGEQLPEGTYFYIFTVDQAAFGEQEGVVRTGFVIIKR